MAEYKTREQALTENAALKQEIDELKTMLQQIIANQKSEPVAQKTNVDAQPFFNDDEYAVEIPPTKYIKVISLYAGGMTLKTSEGGKSFRFDNFGDLITIMYSDLCQIIAHHKRFAEEGYFAILNTDVVKIHNLSEKYKNILDKKTIDNILELEPAKIRELYTKTTKVLRDTIVSLTLQKLREDTKGRVDKNKVQIISELCGIDLYAVINDNIEQIVASKNK